MEGELILNDEVRHEMNRLHEELSQVKQIVSNGLRDRTVRIEGELKELKTSLDKGFLELTRQNGEMHRRIDKCVLIEDYHTDRTKRGRWMIDKWYQVFIVIVSVTLAGVLGYYLG